MEIVPMPSSKGSREKLSWSADRRILDGAIMAMQMCGDDQALFRELWNLRRS